MGDLLSDSGHWMDSFQLRPRKKTQVTTWIIIICVGIVSLFVLPDLVFNVYHLAILPSRLAHIQEHNDWRYTRFRDANSAQTQLPPEVYPDLWKSIKPMYEEFASLHKDVLLRKQLQERCRGMSDLAKSEDPHCRSGSEWPENEVRASHLDHALGFNRAPPVVMR